MNRFAILGAMGIAVIVAALLLNYVINRDELGDSGSTPTPTVAIAPSGTTTGAATAPAAGNAGSGGTGTAATTRAPPPRVPRPRVPRPRVPRPRVPPPKVSLPRTTRRPRPTPAGPRGRRFRRHHGRHRRQRRPGGAPGCHGWKFRGFLCGRDTGNLRLRRRRNRGKFGNGFDGGRRYPGGACHDRASQLHNGQLGHATQLGHDGRHGQCHCRNDGIHEPRRGCRRRRHGAPRRRRRRRRLSGPASTSCGSIRTAARSSPAGRLLIPP